MVKDDDELRKKIISYQDELQKLINESNQIQDKYDEKIKKRTVEINETIINELNNKALVIQNNQLKSKNENLNERIRLMQSVIENLSTKNEMPLSDDNEAANSNLIEKIYQMQMMIDAYERKEIELKEEILKLKTYSISTTDSPMSPPREKKIDDLEFENEQQEVSEKILNDEKYEKKYQDLRRRYKKDRQRLIYLCKRKNDTIVKSLENKLGELNEQIAKLNDDIRIFEEAASDDKNEILSLKDQIIKLTKENEMNKVTDKNFDEMNKSKMEHAEKLEELRKSFELEKLNLEKEIAQANKELQEKNERLVTENEQLILKVISIEADLNKQNQKRIELLKKKFESEKVLVIEEITEFRKKTATLQKEINFKKDKIESLEDELNKVKSKLTRVKFSLKKTTDMQVQEQSKIKSEWIDRSKKIRKEIENDKAKYDEKISALEKDLNEQATKHKNEIENLKVEHNEKTLSLETEKKNYENSIKEAYEMITKTYDSKKVEFESEIERLSKRIKSLEDELLKKSFHQPNNNNLKQSEDFQDKPTTNNLNVPSLMGEFQDKQMSNNNSFDSTNINFNSFKFKPQNLHINFKYKRNINGFKQPNRNFFND